MNHPEVPSDILTGFYYDNAQAVKQKLAQFAVLGSSGCHIVADFDLTLTAGIAKGQNLGTWDVMDALMPPEGVERHRKIYESFRPIELEGKLTETVAIEKWSETLDLICSYGINIDDVEEAFLSVSKLRSGARQLFEICEMNSIPSVILSAGIKNVIQLMADHYKINPTYILATELEVDERRLITGWRQKTLIHMLNKKEMGHSELGPLRQARPHTILLGDVPDDARMVVGSDDVLRVRVLEPRKGESLDLQSALKSSYAAGFDLVVEHDLQPVAGVVGWLVGCSNIKSDSR